MKTKEEKVARVDGPHRIQCEGSLQVQGKPLSFDAPSRCARPLQGHSQRFRNRSSRRGPRRCGRQRTTRTCLFRSFPPISSPCDSWLWLLALAFGSLFFLSVPLREETNEVLQSRSGQKSGGMLQRGPWRACSAARVVAMMSSLTGYRDCAMRPHSSWSDATPAHPHPQEKEKLRRKTSTQRPREGAGSWRLGRGAPTLMDACMLKFPPLADAVEYGPAKDASSSSFSLARPLPASIS